jgi:hypothetical protein
MLAGVCVTLLSCLYDPGVGVMVLLGSVGVLIVVMVVTGCIAFLRLWFDVHVGAIENGELPIFNVSPIFRDALQEKRAKDRQAGDWGRSPEQDFDNEEGQRRPRRRKFRDYDDNPRRHAFDDYEDE